MGFSNDYSDLPDWIAKPEGYQKGAMVKYRGNVFYASFWAAEPGVGDANNNGWRFYDEMYDQTSAHTPQTKQANIIAYIPSWKEKKDFDHTNDEMYKYITHGIVSFLMFDETQLGRLESKSRMQVETILPDVVKIGHRNGTRILIGLGGAEDYGFLKLMTAIGNNPASPLLKTAVKNVVDFVYSQGLDGVDLDLECWWGKVGEPDQGGRLKSDGPHPAGYALTLLAQSLKQAMPTKIVSAAVFGTSWYGNNYDPKIADHVNWLAVMTYDLTGSWNSSPVGPHTALYKIRNQDQYVAEQQGAWPAARSGGVNSTPMEDNPILSVEDTLWYWTNPLFVNWQGEGQKIPRRKIAAGVPIYGYDFAYGKDRPDATTGNLPPGYKTIPYKDILAQFSDVNTFASGNVKVPGSTPTPPFISPAGNYPFAHNIYFETIRTAVAKLQFLKEVGAQGVIIWELSNDVWEEGKSLIQALYKNSGNPAVKQRIEGRRYNECSFICTHNSFVNNKDADRFGAGWIAPNQLTSITNQLKQGARALMLDTYYLEPGSEDHFKVIGEPGVYLLHGFTGHWLLGSTYALPTRRLCHVLYDVWSYLDENPNAVITIFLEDYTTPAQLQAEFDFIAAQKGKQFLERIYNPENDSNWPVKVKTQWPLLADLIAWNKRVIIFSSNEGGQYVAYDRDYTKQNHWTLGFDHTKWDCPSRWDSGVYKPAEPPYTYPKLFLFAHHRDVPDVNTANLDNRYEELINRIDYQCLPKTGQLPNFVAVDLFELPLRKDNVLATVNELNRRWLNS